MLACVYVGGRGVSFSSRTIVFCRGVLVVLANQGEAAVMNSLLQNDRLEA